MVIVAGPVLGVYCWCRLWRGVFLLNLPLGSPLLVLYFKAPESRVRQRSILERPWHRFTGWIWRISSPDLDSRDLRIYGIAERRHNRAGGPVRSSKHAADHPMLPLHLFKSRTFQWHQPSPVLVRSTEREYFFLNAEPGRHKATAQSES